MNCETENTGPVWSPASAKPAGHWLRQVLVGNPFYIISAALLLYGIYRVSEDPRFSDREIGQLIFNFGALQCYGILLTVTALFLAWRRIWYDSTLLVVLECALVFVPFILVSQAVSLSEGTAHLICGMTIFLAAVNFSLLKKFHPDLNLPPMLLCFGAIMAAVNGVLPLMFKSMQETGNAAMTLDVQEATLRFVMTGILPALAMLAVFLPMGRTEGRLASQKDWLPLLIHCLWIIATAVHFYSIQYVYKTPFQAAFFAPAAWVMAWLLVTRLTVYPHVHASKWRSFFLLLPVAVALPVAWPGGSEWGLYLMGVNVVAYAVLHLRNRFNRLSLHLGLLSLAGVIAECHKDFWLVGILEFNVVTWTVICAGGWLVLAALFSRNPRLGLPAAICGAVATAFWLRDSEAGDAIAAQVGFGFALMHSAVWRDRKIVGAKTTRLLLACCWVSHSVWWAHAHAPFSIVAPATTAVALLIGYGVVALLRNVWPPKVILMAAAVVLISIPAGFCFDKAKTTPPGVLAVVGSFLPFAVGTWFALAKSKWFNPPPDDFVGDVAPECRHE